MSPTKEDLLLYTRKSGTAAITYIATTERWFPRVQLSRRPRSCFPLESLAFEIMRILKFPGLAKYCSDRRYMGVEGMYVIG